MLYSFPHPMGDPGIGTTALNQVRGLVAGGHEVTVYTTSTTTRLPPEVRGVRTMSVLGQRIPHRLVGIDRAYRHHDRLVARVVTRRARDFDLVHVWPRACLATLSAAGRVGVPSFRESPGPHTESAFGEAQRAAESLGLTVPRAHSHHPDPARLAEEEAEYAAADFVLAPSDYASSTFVERGFPARRVLRHRYGFDPEAFPAPTGGRDPARPFTGLFLGRGEPNKGLHFALRAWVDAGLAERGQLMIGGDVQPSYQSALRDLFAEARPRQLGFVRHPATVMRNTDVLLLPTFTEGSALVTYEALASGVVPLVSDAAGAPVRDGVDGFVHHVGDVAALAGHLVTLDSDRDLLATMRTNAVSRRDELSWAAAGLELAAAYRCGLALHGSPST